MTQKELDETIAKHILWLDDLEGGIKADLSNTNLSNANLVEAGLTCANLESANLKRASLMFADLSCANLVNVNFKNANLNDAYLSGANLSGADLSNADLRYADLSNTNLTGASFKGSNLAGATLKGAIFDNVNLSYAHGNSYEVKTLHLGTYVVTILVGVKVYIGCKEHTIEEWENFTDKEIKNMDYGALGWWRQWKKVILKVAKGE